MLPRSPCRWLWVTIGAFIELPDNVKEKSIHFQYLVSTLARISSDLASQHDSSEGALTRKTSTALTEIAESPLYHKQVQKTKRRQRTTWSQRPREPKNDDHTLGSPPVAHSIGERQRLAYGLGQHHHKGSQGQSRKRKAVHLARYKNILRTRSLTSERNTSTLPPSVGLCLLSRRPSFDQARPVFAMLATTLPFLSIRFALQR